MSQKSTLYLVATPIGNLADITLRAIDVLKTVDMIAAEDTRHSQRLLAHYQITTPMFSLHEHNEDDRVNSIIKKLSEGQSIALISDAGTPLISDPGFRLVRAVTAAGFSVVPLPGPCALIAALTASGLPTDRFVFEGFLPVKKGALHAYLTSLEKESRTMVFYESVHRIEKTLQVFVDVFGGERVATIARELTKTFETIKQDSLHGLCDWMANDVQQKKGEFVIVLQGVSSAVQSVDDIELERVLSILLKELSLKQAVKLSCEITGLKRKQIYQKALTLSSIISGK